MLELSWGMNEFRLIFVLPNELADGYTRQKYLTQGGKVARRTKEIDRCVTQWVLGIDLS